MNWPTITEKAAMNWLKSLKGFAIGLGKTLIALVIVFVAFLGYAAYSEHSATDKAAAFCGAIVVGVKSSGLLAQAISFGADERQSRWYRDQYGVDHLTVTFTGASPLSRHICAIETKDDRVASRHVVYLD